MNIDKFDNKALELLRTEINTALDGVREKYGLKKLQLGSMSYYPDRLAFNSKIVAEVDPTTSPEAMETKNATNERQSTLLGFNKNIVGEKFMNGRDEFTVVEIKLDRPKWPIIANKKGTNSMYKFQATKNIHWINKDIQYKYDF